MGGRFGRKERRASASAMGSPCAVRSGFEDNAESQSGSLWARTTVLLSDTRRSRGIEGWQKTYWLMRQTYLGVPPRPLSISARYTSRLLPRRPGCSSWLAQSSPGVERYLLVWVWLPHIRMTNQGVQEKCRSSTYSAESRAIPRNREGSLTDARMPVVRSYRALIKTRLENSNHYSTAFKRVTSKM